MTENSHNWKLHQTASKYTRSDILQGQALFRGLKQLRRKRKKENKDKREEDRRKKSPPKKDGRKEDRRKKVKKIMT